MKFKINNPIYLRKDALLAFSIFLLYCFYLYFFGTHYSSFKTITLFGYSFKPTSWLIYLVLILVLILRKQKASTIGVTTKNLQKSSYLGLLFGGVFLLTALVFAFINKLNFMGFNYLAFGFIYYFFEIGLFEELLFRGFIQTRLVGFFKNNILGIVLTGIMFALMHIPFQMSVSELSFIDFLISDSIHLMLTFFYHIIFSLLYYKFNNIAAPTIFHFFLNISYNLFR